MNSSILVIDDEAAIRDLLTMILSEEGYDVSNLAQLSSIEPIIAASPDLVILDMRMPGISGTKLSHMLKANPYTSSIPLLGISAATENETSEMQCDAFLPKPFDVDELLTRVDQLLQQQVRI